MKVILNRVSKGDGGENLPSMSVSYETGAVSFAVVETAARPTVLALIATGRMTPDEGSVTVDGQSDAGLLRDSTAIVDAPTISEPVADLKLAAVVQEELMFAGRPSGRRAVADALQGLGAAEYAKWPVANVPIAVRLSVLSELAAARPGVGALVITSPDRHGGDPVDWWLIAADFARRGFAVLAIVNQGSADDLAELSAEFEDVRQRELAEQAAEAERVELAKQAAEVARQAEPTSPATFEKEQS